MFRLDPPSLAWSGAAVGFLLAAWLQPLCAFAGERTSIGEKIVFSDGDDPELPEQPRSEGRSSKAFEFLDRGNSMSGVIESYVAPLPHSPPNLQRNPRLWEMLEQRLEQRKNWVYNRPEDIHREPSLEGRFGIREYELDDAKTQRTGFAAFFEDREKKPKEKSSLRRKERASDDPDQDERGSQSPPSGEFGGDRQINEGVAPAGGYELNRFVNAGFNRPVGLLPPPYSPGRMTDFTGQRAEPFVERRRDEQSESDLFKKLLAAPALGNPLATGLDPINLRFDTTRQEINPITPSGLNNVLAGSGSSSLDALRAVAGPPSRSSLSVIENVSTKVLGPSSLSPAVAAPVEPRYSQPTPVVLEFPKRKF